MFYVVSHGGPTPLEMWFAKYQQQKPHLNIKCLQNEAKLLGLDTVYTKDIRCLRRAFLVEKNKTKQNIKKPHTHTFDIIPQDLLICQNKATRRKRVWRVDFRSRSFHIQYGQRRVVRSQVSATKATLGFKLTWKQHTHHLYLHLFNTPLVN